MANTCRGLGTGHPSCASSSGPVAVVTVDDYDEALEMAKTWPAGPVEIWPAVER